MSHKDSPDTFPQAEQTRWLETHADDVFLPSVRAQVRWRDVELAVERGAIVPKQAHALWASWAMPGSSTRMGAEGPKADTGFASTMFEGDSDLASDEAASNRRTPLLLGLVVGVVIGALAMYLALSR